MRLSIIILNYQARGLLKSCLKSIQNARLRLAYEIIVVDNNSGDGSLEMVRQTFPAVRTIAAAVNGGCATGNNLGLLAARGEYALILNPDTTVFPNSIEELVVFLDEHPDAALVGPKLVHPDRSTQLSCFRFPDPLIPILRRTPLGRFDFAQRSLRRYLMKDWDHGSTQAVDWVLGACMLVRTRAIEEVGLMDERFFLYFEDVDWCRRFQAHGFRVYYCPTATLVHYHQRLSAENPGLRGIFSATTRTHILSGLLYFMKYRFQERPILQEKVHVSPSRPV